MKHFLRSIILIGILSSCSFNDSFYYTKSDYHPIKDIDYKEINLEETKHNSQLQKALSITGILAQQGVTSYQYGSHNLKTEDKFYALRSKDVILDEYIGKKVKIIGVPIAGYPLSGGPDYIKVLRIEIIKE